MKIVWLSSMLIIEQLEMLDLAEWLERYRFEPEARLQSHYSRFNRDITIIVSAWGDDPSVLCCCVESIRVSPKPFHLNYSETVGVLLARSHLSSSPRVREYFVQLLVTPDCMHFQKSVSRDCTARLQYK